MISIARTPWTYTPANNPIIFTLSGNSPDLRHFQIEIVEESTQATVYTGNIFPTPIHPDTATINLSKTLGSLVRSDVDDTTDIVIGKRKPIIGYQLRAEEYGITNGVFEALSSGVTGTTRYAYESQMDVFNYTANNENKYVVRSGNTAHFLTLQPNFKPVTETSFEQLYFLQEGFDSIKVNVSLDVDTGYIFYYTGSTNNIITPAIPEVRAVATISITDYPAIGDNIGIYFSTGGTPHLLGSWTVPQLMAPSAVAANLASSMVSNPYGFTINYVPPLIKVYAPSGYGVSGNSISISANTVNASTTYTGSSLAVASFTGLSSFSGFSFSATSTISTIDPVYGSVMLGLYTPPPSGTSITGVINGLVNAINSNIYGYSASATSSYSFNVYSRPSIPAIIGTNCAFNFDGDITMLKPFQSGGSGTTVVVYHSVVPNSIIPFSGGTNIIPQSTGVTMDKMIRLQVSPKMLYANGVPTIPTGSQYQVTVTTEAGTPLTETRTYNVVDMECNLSYVNVLWTNSLGGVDSLQMINPQETVAKTKLTINKNNINTDSPTVYLTNNVFNSDELNYASISKSSIKVYTQELTDVEAAWLVELINSKNVYIEGVGTSGILIPVKLVNTNYNIQQLKYLSNQTNQFQFEFAFPDNMLPALYPNVITQ